jgi:hypothetical protein
MRKVLLATTALVALGGVSAAQAEVSISGSAGFEILDTGSGQSFESDGAITIKGSITTDSGLTVSGVQTQAIQSREHTSTDSSDQGADVEDSYIDIAGDFGSIRAGDTDDALDRMDGALPSTYDVEGVVTSNSAQAGGDRLAVSYIAPSVSGITVYGTVEADGAYTGVGVNYSMGPITATYQSVSASTDETMMAASFSSGGIKVSAGSSEEDNGSTKTKTTEVGGSYTMGAMTLIGTQVKQGSTTSNSLGVKYTIAPGFTLSAETGKEGSTQGTYMGLYVAF